MDKPATDEVATDEFVKNAAVTIGLATAELVTDEMPQFFASKPTFVSQVDEKQPKEAKCITSSSVTTMISWWLKAFRKPST